MINIMRKINLPKKMPAYHHFANPPSFFLSLTCRSSTNSITSRWRGWRNWENCCQGNDIEQLSNKNRNQICHHVSQRWMNDRFCEKYEPWLVRYYWLRLLKPLVCSHFFCSLLTLLLYRTFTVLHSARKRELPIWTQPWPKSTFCTRIAPWKIPSTNWKCPSEVPCSQRPSMPWWSDWKRLPIYPPDDRNIMIREWYSIYWGRRR